MMEKILLGALERHLKDNAIIRNLCVTLYDKVLCLVGEEKVIDVFFLNASNAFHTIPHSILLDKSICEVSRGTVHWVKNFRLT